VILSMVCRSSPCVAAGRVTVTVAASPAAVVTTPAPAASFRDALRSMAHAPTATLAAYSRARNLPLQGHSASEDTTIAKGAEVHETYMEGSLLPSPDRDERQRAGPCREVCIDPFGCEGGGRIGSCRLRDRYGGSPPNSGLWWRLRSGFCSLLKPMETGPPLDAVSQHLAAAGVENSGDAGGRPPVGGGRKRELRAVGVFPLRCLISLIRWRQ
jgi:hypothetical protein